MKVYQEQMTAVAKADLLTRRAWRVWAYLVGHATFADRLPVTQKAMAQELGLAQQHVSLALRELMRYQMIFGERVEGRMVYRLNSHFAFKGKGSLVRQRRGYHANHNGFAQVRP